MANFTMTCICGHTDSLEAPNREAAVAMFRAGMTQEALDAHFSQYHQPTDQKPTLDQAQVAIGQMVSV